jgi:hypoxanthine phosphoribosyltransferase
MIWRLVAQQPPWDLTIRGKLEAMQGVSHLMSVYGSFASGAIGVALAETVSADDLERTDGGVHMWRDAIQQVLISEAELHRRIQVLGRRIAADYRGSDLVFVAVLKGALMFSADLARAVDLPLTIDYIALSSYGNRQVSSGRVHLLKDLSETIANKHALIIEDIVDTGISLQYLWNHLMSHHHPADLNVCVLLNKPTRRRVELPIKYTGFEVPDAFVVGYGLDYQQRYRNLPFIGILHPEVFAPGPR